MVARVRRLAGQKRVGHAGTLDPLAEGVLPVLLGRATRLADFIQLGRKTYLATVRLGVSTATDDAEGAVVLEEAVPPLSTELLEAVLVGFRGDSMQTPPQYSALKVAGQRAYAVARAGGESALAQRPVSVYELRLLDWAPAELSLEVTCSRGTYVRALARDIGVALGTVAHLTALTRTRVGSFRLEDALGLETIERSGVERVLLPASQAVPDAPTYSASPDETLRLSQGQAIDAAGLRAECVWVYDPQHHLMCMAAADATLLRPRLAL